MHRSFLSLRHAIARSVFHSSKSACMVCCQVWMNQLSWLFTLRSRLGAFHHHHHHRLRTNIWPEFLLMLIEFLLPCRRKKKRFDWKIGNISELFIKTLPGFESSCSSFFLQLFCEISSEHVDHYRYGNLLKIACLCSDSIDFMRWSKRVKSPQRAICHPFSVFIPFFSIHSVSLLLLFFSLSLPSLPFFVCDTSTFLLSAFK